MNSRIFHGMVRHSRHAPKEHSFAYRVFWLALDPEELPHLDANVKAFGHNRRSLVSVLDRDYGGPGDGNIRGRVLDHLKEAGINEPTGRIELMTIPRVAGYVFNPVSFYLCATLDGRLSTLVAEVRNTFGEMHHYVARLEPVDSHDPSELFCRIPKRFYVSPFFQVEGEYDIRVSRADESFSINIDLIEHGNRVFSASLRGEGSALTSRSLRRTIFKLPLFAATIMLRIHWQALRLYFGKRVRMFGKPPPSDPATIPSSSVPWWVRLRTVGIRLAANRQTAAPGDPESFNSSKDSL